MKIFSKIPKITMERRINMFNYSDMSFPSRLSLWSGILLVVYGYLNGIIFATILGITLILSGIIIWVKCKEEKISNKNLQRIKSFKNKFKWGNTNYLENNNSNVQSKKESVKDRIMSITPKKSTKEQEDKEVLRQKMAEGAKALIELRQAREKIDE